VRGDVAAWTIAGGAVWSAIWCYDQRRSGCRQFRVLDPFVDNRAYVADNLPNQSGAGSYTALVEKLAPLA